MSRQPRQAEDTKKEARVAAALAMLKSKTDIQWKLTHTIVRRTNLYLTKGHQAESLLSSHRDDARITIYRRFGDMIGEHAFSLLSADKKEIEAQIREAMAICQNTQKRQYDLPSPKAPPAIPLADPEIVAAFKKGVLDRKLLAIADQVREEFSHKHGFKLNGMELLASHDTTAIYNSKGMRVVREGTDVYLEMVITAVIGEKEQEYLPSLRVRRLRDLDIKSHIQEYARMAHDVLIAYRPNRFKGQVILSKDALRDFFAPHQDVNPMIAHCFARWKHMGISKYKENEYITNRPIIGDKITITSNPLVPYNADAEAFDEDGVPGQQITLIKDGLFKAYLANKRYADYLGVPPTGPLGVIMVRPGSKSAAQLYASKKAVYEIVALSSFVPNDVSGDFTAEIRLGYMIDGDKRTPFKGGMFTGNIFDLMSNAYFSKETEKMSGYIGPSAVRFENGVVSGM